MRWIHNFQLFLFDFDGLLVDTEKIHFQAYVDALRQRGHALDWSFTRYCGMAHSSATAIREGIYAEFPHLDVEWEQLYAEKKQMYMELLTVGRIELMPGVEPLIKALDKAKIRRCVVTHSALEQVALIRSRLPILDLIPQWITREDYEKAKPDPECYLKAITLYGHQGDRIIGFEDSIRGLEALKGTPALPVLICSSHHPLIKVAIEGDVIHFESFNDILDNWN